MVHRIRRASQPERVPDPVAADRCAACAGHDPCDTTSAHFDVLGGLYAADDAAELNAARAVAEADKKPERIRRKRKIKNSKPKKADQAEREKVVIPRAERTQPRLERNKPPAEPLRKGPAKTRRQREAELARECPRLYGHLARPDEEKEPEPYLDHHHAAAKLFAEWQDMDSVSRALAAVDTSASRAEIERVNGVRPDATAGSFATLTSAIMGWGAELPVALPTLLPSHYRPVKVSVYRDGAAWTAQVNDIDQVAGLNATVGGKPVKPRTVVGGSLLYRRSFTDESIAYRAAGQIERFWNGDLTGPDVDAWVTAPVSTSDQFALMLDRFAGKAIRKYAKSYDTQDQDDRRQDLFLKILEALQDGRAPYQYDPVAERLSTDPHYMPGGVDPTETRRERRAREARDEKLAETKKGKQQAARDAFWAKKFELEVVQPLRKYTRKTAKNIRIDDIRAQNRSERILRENSRLRLDDHWAYREIREDGTAEVPDWVAWQHDPANMADRDGAEADIAAVIDGLPDSVREIVRLRIAGKSFKEVGAELGITESAAVMRLQRFQKSAKGEELKSALETGSP